jgi:hypothetical protein
MKKESAWGHQALPDRRRSVRVWITEVIVAE